MKKSLKKLRRNKITISAYKSIFFSLVLFFITIHSFSQSKQYLYYFDKQFNPAKKSQSVFNGIGVFNNGFIEVKIYNSRNGNLVYIEHYTDSSLQSGDGLFQSYYTNASKEWEGNYLKGKEDGLWQRWDSLGHIIDSAIYNNGEKVMEAHFGYNENAVLKSFVINNIKTDQLQKTYYSDSGEVVSEVSLIGQHGFEKYYHNGVIVRTDSLLTRDEIEASFPGGPKAWSQYVQDQVQSNQDKFSSDDYGTCVVKFIIGKEGEISGAEAITMRGTKLAEIAVRVIRNGPKWKPAMQYGRPVYAYRIVPVSLFNPAGF